MSNTPNIMAGAAIVNLMANSKDLDKAIDVAEMSLKAFGNADAEIGRKLQVAAQNNGTSVSAYPCKNNNHMAVQRPDARPTSRAERRAAKNMGHYAAAKTALEKLS